MTGNKYIAAIGSDNAVAAKGRQEKFQQQFFNNSDGPLFREPRCFWKQPLKTGICLFSDRLPSAKKRQTMVSGEWQVSLEKQTLRDCQHALIYLSHKAELWQKPTSYSYKSVNSDETITISNLRNHHTKNLKVSRHWNFYYYFLLKSFCCPTCQRANYWWYFID